MPHEISSGSCHCRWTLQSSYANILDSGFGRLGIATSSTYPLLLLLLPALLSDTRPTFKTQQSSCIEATPA